jgi:hypothetical protein
MNASSSGIFVQASDRAALKRLLSVLRDARTIAPRALPPII